MAIIEIMFSDLKEPKQQELLKAYNVSSQEDMNWGIFPVTVIEVTLEDEPQPVV